MEKKPGFFALSSSNKDPIVRRQSRLLMMMSLAIMVLAIIAYQLYGVLTDGSAEVFPASVFYGASFVVFFIPFLWAKTGRYKIGAGQMILAFIAIVVYGGTSDAELLLYLVMPIIFSSIFFSTREIIWTFLACEIGTLFVAWSNQNYSLAVALGGGSLYLATHAVMVFLSSRQQRQLELIRRSDLEKEILLRKGTEKELKQKIHDLEILNEATVNRELRMRGLKEKIKEIEEEKRKGKEAEEKK